MTRTVQTFRYLGLSTLGTCSLFALVLWLSFVMAGKGMRNDVEQNDE